MVYLVLYALSLICFHVVFQHSALTQNLGTQQFHAVLWRLCHRLPRFVPESIL